jgi:hypothetical protein
LYETKALAESQEAITTDETWAFLDLAILAELVSGGYISAGDVVRMGRQVVVISHITMNPCAANLLLPQGAVKFLTAVEVGVGELPAAVAVGGICKDGLPVHRRRQIGGRLQNVGIIRGSGKLNLNDTASEQTISRKPFHPLVHQCLP